jgi:flagellar basal body rod protein FlgG
MGFLVMAQALLYTSRMNVSLYQAAAALDANSRWQDMISENLASSSVPGFRKQELAVAAVQAGLMPATSGGSAKSPHFFVIPKATNSTSFKAGDLQYTGDDHNIAIEGKGFFQVQLPNGAIASTRDGEFQVSSQGQLVTKEGYPVMGASGPIQLDVHNGTPLSISSNGEVSQGAQIKGKLNLVEYPKPELLKQISGAYFLGQGSQIQTQPSTSTVRQGYLEGSNTSTEMANMMTAMRTYEANTHVIQIQDDRLGKVISELGSTTN